MRRILYHGLKAYTGPMSKRFERALENPMSAQQLVLNEIVADLMQTEYGKHYEIKSAENFKQRLPLISYDDISDWMLKQREHENKALVASPVAFYEKTSGSSGPAKYIPYTEELRKSFTRMFLLWAHDLIANVPGLGNGKFYFSVSPNFDTERETELGVPVGLDDDAEYLGGAWRKLLTPFMHSDPRLGKIRDPEEFKQALSLSLLCCTDLETISIWNPSFLMLVTQWIEENRDLVLKLMSDTLQPFQIKALQQQPIDWSSIWPKLKLISCWADANAQPLAEKLAKQFPNVYIQGKGLLATEAPMTIPMVGVKGGVPLVSETYFEFLDEQQNVLTIDELEQGKRYEIVISQKGGLCRYRMGDEVEVVGKKNNTPTLNFVGRNNRTSDLVGEKLNEGFVRDVVESLPVQECGFRSLMAVRRPQDGYVLVLDKQPTNEQALAQQLENALQQAYHYRHARALGQLNSARVAVVPEVENIVSHQAIENGKTLGDMKQNYLILSDDSLQHAFGLN
ncbi:MAG: GH3 auxin-responsive promoter family protein [Pseudomonadales bacterium]|nr:GH3 auxin-responsive promoter family protein [Pseudomonadales bacterium]